MKSQTPLQTNRANPAIHAAVSALTAIALSACTNSFLSGSGKANRVSAAPTGAPANPSTIPTYKIASVQIQTPSADPDSPPSGATPTASILIDPTQSTGVLSNSCTFGAPGEVNMKACFCLFEWVEVNNTGSTTVNIPHSDLRNITTVQSNLAACPAPRFWSSIDPGTVIKVSIVPQPTNSQIFHVPPYNYTKSTSSAQGSFQDAQGASFANIYRYSCYETVQTYKGFSSFLNSFKPSDRNDTRPTVSGGAYATEVYASGFCARPAPKPSEDGAQEADSDPADSDPAEGCPPNNLEASNQSYYYNLFIRATDRGQVNSSNARYTCPKVSESLYNTGLDFWPMDTSFALSLSRTAQFKIGVEAFSKLGIGNDPGSVQEGCDGDASSPPSDGPADNNSSSILKSCIGFAAKPNSDGSCPYIKSAQGTIRPTFRLRRLIALYPPRFDATGRLMAGKQATDMIYVIDRPVSSSAATPTKPYAMRGPKPCPFSYYDQKGVLSDPNDVDYPGGMPGYAATNYSGWNGTNVDGIEFPNRDVAGGSCSAALPILNENKSRWSVTTLNRRNPLFKRLFVRPTRAWAPHYMEDIDFQACAPLADPLKDPPLHFAKDPSTGNVAWCAEAYPTQNTHVAKIDRLKTASNTYPGKVRPYTSHVVKNAAGTACSATPLSLADIVSGYPANPSAANPNSCRPATQSYVGAAHHPNNMITDIIPSVNGTCPNSSILDGGACHFCTQQTCDRTVASTGIAWSRFPLLARPSQVEAAMMADSTYGCIVSYDSGGAKSGKVSPTEGCCGAAVRVWTGFDNSANPNPNRVNTSAHLEPTEQCLTPSY